MFERYRMKRFCSSLTQGSLMLRRQKVIEGGMRRRETHPMWRLSVFV